MLCKECMYDAPHNYCCKVECGEHEFCRGCEAKCRSGPCPKDEAAYIIGEPDLWVACGSDIKLLKASEKMTKFDMYKISLTLEDFAESMVLNCDGCPVHSCDLRSNVSPITGDECYEKLIEWGEKKLD